LSFASNGDLLVNVNSGKVLRVTPGGGVSEFATGLNNPIGMAFAANGDLYVSNLDNTIRRFPLGLNPTVGAGEIFASGISSPREIDFDSAGNLYVASGGTLFRYTPGGVQSIFASGFSDLNAVGVAANGDVWVGDYGTSKVSRFDSAGQFLSETLVGPSSTLVANVASNPAPSSVPDPGSISLLLGLGLLSLGLVACGGENRER
jgi:sugar lactone lactonase YvrE